MFEDWRHAGPLGRAARVGLVMLAITLCLFPLDILIHGRGYGTGQEFTCAYTSRCRPSYGNSHLCDLLPVGIPERELYFRLGQPTGKIGNALTFDAGATERGPIEIELDADGRAARITCRAGAVPRS